MNTKPLTKSIEQAIKDTERLMEKHPDIVLFEDILENLHDSLDAIAHIEEVECA